MFKERLKTHHASELKSSKFSLPITKYGLEKRLSKTPDHKEGIIYFHVPYCDKICSFCSMNRSKLGNELDDYVEYLLKEIEYFSKFDYIKQKSFESIYFGGGTPTILKIHHLEKILTAINKNFNISPSCEFNFESTLHNLNSEKIALMQSLGVNRYSIGIQTFSNAGRKFLNRTGSGEAALEKLFKIKEEFSGNVCVDIIYNYPNQTLDEILHDAECIKKFKADSVSFYSLQFMKGSSLDGTPLQNYYDLQTDQKIHHAFLNALLNDDYQVLELTKLNKKDQYKYIKLSHKGVDMLPIGVFAGGAIAKMVGFSPKKNLRFFKNESEKNHNLKIFTNLFQYPKISFSDMRKYISDHTYARLLEFLKEAEKNGLLVMNNESVSYTHDGIFWGNNITNKALNIALKG